MNNIILNYLIKSFIKKFLIVISIFYLFGIILNLFEEVEFFKNLNVNFITPLILASIFIPSLIVKILPFIIFISSMWFMTVIKNNKDLLTLKIYGFSNIKVFVILALTAFTLGWMTLILANPITSSLSKYYEQVKANYSRDIDHLINFNNDGLWIKETIEGKQRFISSTKLENNLLRNVMIIHLNENSSLVEKINADSADIRNNEWILYDVKIFKTKDNLFTKHEFAEYKINSVYNLNKINGLFKNFDTMAFIDLLFNYEDLINNGYTKNFLNQSLHSLLTLPFFLALMTGLASILTMYNLKKSKSLHVIVVGLVTVVIIYYLKDFSLALGQIERVPLILSIWSPIIILTLLTFVGVLQINEK